MDSKIERNEKIIGRLKPTEVKPKSADNAVNNSSLIGRYEQDLINRCFQGKAQAQRLMNLEFQRDPELSKENAAKYAIQSLMRD